MNYPLGVFEVISKNILHFKEYLEGGTKEARKGLQGDVQKKRNNQLYINCLLGRAVHPSLSVPEPNTLRLPLNSI